MFQFTEALLCASNDYAFLRSFQERLANIGPEEFVETFISRDDADFKVMRDSCAIISFENIHSKNLTFFF